MSSNETSTSQPTSLTNSEVTAGEIFLQRAQEILAAQLGQLRELHDTVNKLAEEASQERRNLGVDREEISYRLRYMQEKPDPLLKGKALEKRRVSLLEKQVAVEKRDHHLDTLLLDLNDSAKRLNLLTRQLEIASSQLTRVHPLDSSGSSQVSENPWEVALRAQLIQGQEEERKRLAREVHDGPAQVLANAAMQLDFVGQLLHKDRPNAISELINLRGVMRDSLAEVRSFMFNLQPKMLAEQGLSPTLQHYCTDFANQYNIAIEVNLPEFNGLLNPNQELAAFRVVQEALQNIRKHAGATKVVVSAGRDPDGKLIISITDDGRGFDPATIGPDIVRGAGLPGMRERAELIGGKLKINSKPGYGTEICLII